MCRREKMSSLLLALSLFSFVALPAIAAPNSSEDVSEERSWRLSAQQLPPWWGERFPERPRYGALRMVSREPPGALEEPLRSIYALGFSLAALRTGRPKSAQRALAELQFPPLQSLIDFLRADAALQGGDYQSARILFEETLRQDPGSLWSHRARFRLADALAGTGDLRAASNQLRVSLRRYPEYPYFEPALLALIRWELRLGNLDEESAAQSRGSRPSQRARAPPPRPPSPGRPPVARQWKS